MHRGYRYSLVRKQVPFTPNEYKYYITDFKVDKVYTCNVRRWEDMTDIVKDYLMSSNFEWVADSNEFEALLGVREYL